MSLAPPSPTPEDPHPLPGQIILHSGKTPVVPAVDSATKLRGAEQNISDHNAVLERSARRFELLAETAGELLQATDPQKVVESLCRKVMEFLDCHAFFNFLVDERFDRLHLNACAGIPPEEAKRIAWLDYGVAVCGCAARDGCRIVAEHIPTTPDPRTDLVKSYGIKAYACHPLLGPGGKVIGTLSFGTKSRETFSDNDLSLMKAVTDQVAVAMVRMRNEKDLRESQADLKRAQAVAHMGSWRMNVMRNELLWSEETYRIFDIPQGTAMSYEKFIDAVHSDDREHVNQEWEAALQGKTYDIEHRIVVGDTIKWVRERAELEFDDNDALLGGFGTVQDITKRKQQEEHLQKTASDLARSNADLERFAYVASHDLQEPLRTIRAYVQLLEKRYKNKLGTEADEFINFIVDGAGRMQTLILDLLAYSRIGGQGQPHARTEIKEALDTALLALKDSISTHNVIVTHDSMPVVKCDKSLIAQLLQNLIGNAIKFLRQDIQPKVHVGVKEQESPVLTGKTEWLFSVQDNGIGIDPKYYERIFTIFKRLHTAAKYPGTGIGLAICKRIVERHGGRIWLDSQPGEGTTFFFTLPKA